MYDTGIFTSRHIVSNRFRVKVKMFCSFRYFKEVVFIVVQEVFKQVNFHKKYHLKVTFVSLVVFYHKYMENGCICGIIKWGVLKKISSNASALKNDMLFWRAGDLYY